MIAHSKLASIAMFGLHGDGNATSFGETCGDFTPARLDSVYDVIEYGVRDVCVKYALVTERP